MLTTPSDVGPSCLKATQTLVHSKSESKEDRTVTVAIPFARERIDFVRCALDSLLAQDHTNWRGIVLDDSPEGSAELASLVASYADLRLRYTRYDGPHGIGQAWNACLEAVETDLFSLLHTDDELEPWYISRMIRLAEQYPSAAMYFCRANIIDDQGSSCFSLADKIKDAITPNTEPVILTGADAIRSLAVGDFIICPTILYRNSQLGDRRFSTKHNFVLDLRFILEVLLDGATIVGTHDEAYRYRRHAAQWTSRVSASGHRFMEEIDVLREVEEIAEKRNWPRVRRAARLRSTLRLNIFYEIMRDLVGRQPRRAAEKARYLWR